MGVTLPPELASLLHEAGGRWPEADEDQLHELANSWRGMGERLEGVRSEGAAVARSVAASHSGASIEAFSAYWSKVDERLGQGAVASHLAAVAVDSLAQVTLDTKSALVGVLSAANAQRETMNQASAGMIGPLLRLLLPILRKHISTILSQAVRVIRTAITSLSVFHLGSGCVDDAADGVNESGRQSGAGADLAQDLAGLELGVRAFAWPA